MEVSFGAGHTYFENEETPDVTKFRLLLISPESREIPIACSRIDSKAVYAKERGRINFPNYASQLQAIFARFKSRKILK